MKKGRPPQSQIRQNIVEILHFLGQGYGYQISKIYNELFSKVSQRSIYYHLKKGTFTGELMLNKIKQEKGNFSWGNSVEKRYYSLGEKAQPRQISRIKEHFLKSKPSL